MLDEKDLQAIGQMMAQQKQEIKTELRQEIMQDMKVLLDVEVKTQFNLLAEGIQDIQEKLVPRSRVDELEDEMKLLKSIVRQMSEDLQKLKKAN